MVRKLIAGNWKMNGTRAGGTALARDLAIRYAEMPDPAFDMLLCPPTALLVPVGEAIAGSGVSLGAQDCHAEDSGAFTGDTSAATLRDIGAGFVIVGHSERRQYHSEIDLAVAAKAEAAHRNGLVAIICIGETLEERDAGQTLAVCSRQLAGSVPPTANAENTVIAYEPVWAIGTGRAATVEDVSGVHNHLRSEIARRVPEGAASVRLLYGGSVKASNAAELMAVPNVDGALVGGASLKADDFWGIAESCK